MEEHCFNPPKYLDDEINLQAIFPEEVWLLIFDSIKDSNHYHSIDAASPYFHKLLLPLRTRVFFSEVIKLCTKYMVSSNSYSSLLLCRAVCRTWKRAADTRIQDILHETNTDCTNWKFVGYPLNILSLTQECIMEQHNIYDQSKLDNFLENFHISHFLTGSNPFLTRSIYILSTTDNKLFDILQIYGHHIWHCYVRLSYQTQEQKQEEVRYLLKLLGLLPNLQTLRISNIGKNGDTKFIENMLTANALPTFKNLNLLAEYNVPGPIFSQLLQNNSHIKRLGISRLDIKNHSALLTTPLPNLEEFHVLGFASAGDFLQLQNVQVQWLLKKLTFSFFCNNGDALHVNHVFNWIETRRSESLTELSIVASSRVSLSEIASTLKLPNLKHLKIKMGRDACLDFILPLSECLLSLSVHWLTKNPYDVGLEKNSKIQFFTHRENLGKSNIWKFFPKLKEINFADESVQNLRSGHAYERAYGRNDWVGFSFVSS